MELVRNAQIEAYKASGELVELVTRANEMAVVSDEDVVTATECIREIKRVGKAIKEWIEPQRVAAKEAYDAVLSTKKALIDPLDGAEKGLKEKISAYDAEKRRKAREAEEALRKAALAEAERKLAEAAKAREAGDALEAEFAEVDAEALMDTAMSASVVTEDAKASGMSRRKGWEITGIDLNAVPTTFNGVVIRPVDERAVLALIKQFGGKVEIPGITFTETSTIAVR